LLLGWDAADWKMIRPLLAEGLLPTLQALIERGATGDLATLEPMLSPMLWNTIATGKTPDAHGILGFVEPKPDDQGIRTVSSLSRRSKALWNILNQNGLRSLVFNWFASFPAEPINGLCVTNHYQHPVAFPEEPWPLRDGVVHPPELADMLAELRVHPGELGPDAILPFLGDTSHLTPSTDKRLKELIGMFAQCLSVHAASTWALENLPWDFCAIYHDAIDHFGHVFMPYHPPQLAHISDGDFQAYQTVMRGIYRFHDMMLTRLLQLAGDDATVLIISDHGFHSDHLRPGPTAGPVAWHKPFGVFVASGQGVRSGAEVYGANLLDIAPTILSLFGLPPGEDMPGRVLTAAFENLVEPTRIFTWEEIEGDSGQHPPDAQQDTMAEHEAIKQLVALGYIESPDGDVQKAVDRVTFEMRRNLAETHRSLGRSNEAAEILTQLHEERPADYGVSLRLAQNRLVTGDLAGCRALVEEVLTHETDKPAATLLRANLAMVEGNIDEALVLYLEAERLNERLPGLHNQIGYCYLKLQRWADAERAFAWALEKEGDSVPALHGMCVAMLGLVRADEAIDHGLRAIELRHHYPKAHFHLGQALAMRGRYREAAQAFETAAELLPKAPAPRLALAELYEYRLGNPERASQLRDEAERLSKSRSLKPLE